MDSDDSDRYCPATAFCVGPLREEDMDLSSPPMNGMEYLQRVMLETKKCSKVVSVNLDAIRHPKFQIITGDETKTTSPYAPSIEWQEQQVANFSKIRQKISCMKLKKCPVPRVSLPAIDDDEGWRSLCLGQLCIEKEESDNSDHGTPPLLSIVTGMGQPVLDQLLSMHNKWLNDCNHMTHLHGQWLYALLACLELPLHPDTCSNIRSIARSCQNIRTSMVKPESSELAAVNLIICLVGKYFRQNDLAD